MVALWETQVSFTCPQSKQLQRTKGSWRSFQGLREAKGRSISEPRSHPKQGRQRGKPNVPHLERALNRDDFPTLGTPTIPIWRLLEGRPRKTFFSAAAASANEETQISVRSYSGSSAPPLLLHTIRNRVVFELEHGTTPPRRVVRHSLHLPERPASSSRDATRSTNPLATRHPPTTSRPRATTCVDKSARPPSSLLPTPSSQPPALHKNPTKLVEGTGRGEAHSWEAWYEFF